MKIIKKKEVVTEEIEIHSGTYCFECHEGSYHKIILKEHEEDFIDYRLESVENYLSPYGIRIITGTIFDEEEVPYKFSGFIRGVSGKKIEKEEQKQQVIERIANG